jgi:phosphate transport system substrate-binding protein
MRFLQKFTIAAACASALVVGVAAQQKVQINGAGATFPYPIYSKWFSEYNKLHPNVEINYQSIGSGGGIRQITNGTVFFGATDGPMTNDQQLAAPSKILHFPTVLGADVPVYNIPNVNAELKFTGAVLADIFLGKITKWNDPSIVKLNAGVNLPATDITVVHRSDASGTSYIWVDYLAKVSPEWRSRVGVATAVNWPVGLGGKGNEGVTGLIKQTPNAIGYVEFVYAVQNKLPYAEIKNRSGAFVTPTLESVTAAASAASASMPADFRVSITDPAATDAYPIASFTWLLVPSTIADAEKGPAIVKFLGWMLEEGQTYTKPLGYAPLPDAVIAMERKAISSVRTTAP